MIIDSHLHVYADDESQFPYVAGGKPGRPAAVEYLLPLMDEAGVDKAVIVQPRTYSWDTVYRRLHTTLPRSFHRIGTGRSGLAGRPRQTERAGQRVRLRRPSSRTRLGRGSRPRPWKGSLAAVGTCPATGRRLRHSGLGEGPFLRRADGGQVSRSQPPARPLERPAPRPGETCSPYRRDDAPCKVPERACESVECAGQVAGGFPFRDTYDLIERIYDAYGPQRLLWGTDFPGVMVKCGYANAVELVRTHIPFFTEDYRDWIFHKTAEKVFARLVGRSNSGDDSE